MVLIKIIVYIKKSNIHFNLKLNKISPIKKIIPTHTVHLLKKMFRISYNNERKKLSILSAYIEKLVKMPILCNFAVVINKMDKQLCFHVYR